MQTKIFELRDSATFIPVMAMRLGYETVREAKLLVAGGWGAVPNYIMFMRLDDIEARAVFDPYHWDDRTFSTAHTYICNNFDMLESGDVIDVEFILGETNTKKLPQ